MSILAACGACVADHLVSRIDAITIAKETAVANGHNLQEYEMKWVEERTPMIDNRPIWKVLFEGKKGIMGDHFGVVIDRQTRKTTFVPGE